MIYYILLKKLCYVQRKLLRNAHNLDNVKLNFFISYRRPKTHQHRAFTALVILFMNILIDNLLMQFFICQSVICVLVK